MCSWLSLCTARTSMNNCTSYFNQRKGPVTFADRATTPVADLRGGVEVFQNFFLKELAAHAGGRCPLLREILEPLWTSISSHENTFQCLCLLRIKLMIVFILQVCADIKNLLESDLWIQTTDRWRGNRQKNSLLFRKYRPRTSIVTGVYAWFSCSCCFLHGVLKDYFKPCSHRSGGSKGGARGTRAPSWGPKFFQFHAVFGKIWQNRMLAPPLGSWRPLLREILDPPLHREAT